ncbi:scopoletin glucosyltransferase-like [Cornus florida]|uniref:scopoletin glucosyltransferase-like n=1 Tax=Cornus florida TaxID=4283 RepID=UPI002896CDB1|nr:scopoletin glucosyltransferase-like [Cornus florida]
MDKSQKINPVPFFSLGSSSTFLHNLHMIPTMDMAKLFASHGGVKTTIITTPLNAPIFAKAIQTTKNMSNHIAISVIKFPAEEAGLPDGCENVDQIHSEDMVPNFFKATTMLQGPLEHAIEEGHPDCLVADMFFPWATDIAAKFNIPRLVFHGTSVFALCAGENMRLYKPQKNVSSDYEPFIVPNLPHEVKITKMQLADHDKEDIETDFSKLLDKAIETEMTSFGVVVNSFHELEPAYADHYRRVLGRKAWHIGPVSLCNREVEDKAQRGKETSIDKLACLKWLDSKKPNSVIYVCFGSGAGFATSQLYEIAMGLEASGQEFIWVVRRAKNEDDNENWSPEGFEERTKDKGLIIRGWAPQVLILDHDAVGGFVTHCGWNSTLEGVSAGVPMVTWPFFADQFFNEKLVTEILKIGVCVGSDQQWKRGAIDGVKSEAIENAVKEIMVGEEAEERRRRARTLKEMASKAVEEGGSSHTDLNALIKELSAYQVQEYMET